MGNNRTVVPVLVPKDTIWQDKIVDMCVEGLVCGSIPIPQVGAGMKIKIIKLVFSFQLKL